MKKKSTLFPLMVDLSNKKIVIFGAGSVAEHKATLLSDYGDVFVVNEQFNSSFKQLEETKKIKLITANLQQLEDQTIVDFVSGAFLVIPATKDSLFNRRITTLAKNSGALVNQVDRMGEVIIPSVISNGNVLVGISSNGTSPAFSKFLRSKIEQVITPQYTNMARLQKEMREHYKSHISSQDERKQKLWDILNNDSIWEALTVDYDKAKKIALSL